MPAEFLLKGMLTGLLFGVPIGAVGAMTVQRTLNHGLKAGLLTGLGSSSADCFYACIGVFGLNLISDFLIDHQRAINLIGGSLLLIMGIHLLCRKKEALLAVPKSGSGIKMFLSSFVIGITSPAAILTFLFAFPYLGVLGRTGFSEGVQLVCGVFVGTYFWWGILSMGADALREKMKTIDYGKTNQVFGAVLALFGATVFIKTI